MSPQPLQHPQRPNPPKPRSQVNNQSQPPKRNNGSNNRGNENRPNNQPPSPWLNSDNPPQPNSTASFVEYLRWMREPEREYKDATKLQILQIAQENANNYGDRLKQLNQRTELIVGKNNTFTVKCPWRIRIGGHRGPESILLPAFDALGMPYIPASTLRGVARTQAIREIVAAEKIKWKDAEQKVAPYFGSIETANLKDSAGKVVFLDAYPLPSQTGGLSIDMANNIWKWDENQQPKYDSNPNVFLSLQESSFLIGLRLVSNCQDNEILNKVKQWLIVGLQAGVGSQINTGYGQLILGNQDKSSSEFFRVKFAIEGQLIHGHQKFNNVKQPFQTERDDNLKTDRNGNLKPATSAVSEVRPTAFKSILRYWFRAFALGVLSTEQVINWEGQIFGAITPKQQLGWVKVNIFSGTVTQREAKNKNDDCGEQEGILTLSYSVATPQDKTQVISSLLKNLTWMMFNLGGIGQGARRPCYSRRNRQNAPWFRGSTFILDEEDNPNLEDYWFDPGSAKEFQKLFKTKLKAFYSALEQLILNSNISQNINSPLSFNQPSDKNWSDAVDQHCRIVVCSGEEQYEKPHALAVLHSQDLKINNSRGQLDYDGNLCGQTNRPVKPSPVWIADLEDYQVVTVFGATVAPRSKYLQKLKQESDQYYQIFPFN
ncbi:MAG: type III-B CRISPR module RAMP protein Cmr6 [Pleurocapsa minor HA4230-MV1]|jgi:CRISPR-associated protein Cmr6|nr:type III-B CRISPR module RAMP protein Cmr6 [Pleurocapsa minor HA4230-MV1]